MKTLLLSALSICLLYCGLLGWLYFRQEGLLFFPTALPPDFRFDMPGVSEESVTVDGAVLQAVHFRQSDARGLVFFLHGNGGNLQDWLSDTEFYRRAGYDLFMIDYRGYGRSSGRIASEAQLHDDVLRAWRQVAPEYADRRLVIYGRSLGTGLATKLATQVDASLLVLVSPYSSLLQIAREKYPWVPGFVMRYPMRLDQWLPAVRMPVVMVHGARDALIGVAQAEALKKIKPDADLHILPDATHGDVHLFPQYTELLLKKLTAL